MPYELDGNCVKKKDTGETVKCHDTHEEALAHFRALQANVKDSAIVEMSMRISKASYNKSEPNAMRWTAIDSDVEDDLYHEKMSPELYKDFVNRIENQTPIPAPFDQVICEGSDWCGGTPYLSIAHYKAGSSRKNVPGDVESVFIDGTRLKSKGVLHNNDLGRAVWEKLREDMYIKEKSTNPEHLPIRISIGFLDLEHKHVGQATDFTFVRKNLGEICPLCAQGIGGKIYTKGQLVHLAMTRVPVNPRTEMSVERSMDDIQTKRQDAESIVGKLADELEEKSIPSDVLVVRAEGDGSMPTPEPYFFSQCYDPNTGKWDQACIDATMNKFMADCRDMIGTTVKSLVDEVVEEARRKDVSDADKKHAEKKYGDVTYADETNKKYPIDTEEHVRAALSYWGMPKNREKYSAEDQKKISSRIHSAAKKFGINVTDKKSDTVEESTMANETKEVEVKEESVLGIPEKPFTYAGLDGNGNNNIPSPVKSKKADDAEDAKDNGDDEEMEKSFAQLKSLVKSGATVEQINEAFGNLGTSVEKSYAEKKTAANAGIDYNAIGEIVRSAVAPLQVKIAELEGKLKSSTVSTEQVVKSKALTLSGYPTQESMIQRATPQPTRKLSKIEEIAYRSTGAIK